MSLQQAETVLRRYLNMREQKLTQQRELILRVFFRAKSHLTIETLYSMVKAKNPNIGMTTVYRMVKILCECGLATGFRHTDGTFRYELSQKYHEHLVCIKCGRITEVADPEIEKLQNTMAQKNNFKILHSRLELYGICGECHK